MRDYKQDFVDERAAQPCYVHPDRTTRLIHDGRPVCLACRLDALIQPTGICVSAADLDRARRNGHITAADWYKLTMRLYALESRRLIRQLYGEGV